MKELAALELGSKSGSGVEGKSTVPAKATSAAYVTVKAEKKPSNALAEIEATLRAEKRSTPSLPNARKAYDVALANLEKSRASTDVDQQERALEAFRVAKQDLADAQKKSATTITPTVSSKSTYMDVEASKLEAERKELEREASKLASMVVSKESTIAETRKAALAAAKERLAQVDICFIMDITGSMSAYVDQAKASIQSILQYFASGKAAERAYKFRFAFVGYRDHKDATQYEVKDFTTDPDDMQKFIAGIVCSGGGDTCEDVAGGLFQSLILNWKSKTRLAFLVCDAPPHGRQYHDGAADDYLDGDPNGRNPEELLKEMRELGMDVFVSEITPLTKKMFGIFKLAYDDRQADRELGSLDLADDPTKFRPKVIHSIQQSMTATVSRATKAAIAASKYK